jgi:hypothetical protein
MDHRDPRPCTAYALIERSLALGCALFSSRQKLQDELCCLSPTLVGTIGRYFRI